MKKGPAPNISSMDRRRSSNMMKKHVQFPEDFKCLEEEEEGLCTTDSNGTGPDLNDSSPRMLTMEY